MAMRRHSVAGTTHVKSLTNAAGVPLDNGTLQDLSVRLLARAVGLGWHDFQTRKATLPELARLLLREPVVAFGFFNYSDAPTARKHAVAIFALVGDGTAPAATVNPFTDDWEDFTESVADITFLLSY